MVGVDEVGRGSWAGPLLVVAAREVSQLPEGLYDSKQMTRAHREKFFLKLQKSCNFGEGWVTAIEIDSEGLANALRLGVSRALKALKARTIEEIIYDGKVNYVSPVYTKVNCLIDADALVPLVSAAGIYAKVRRDGFMRKLHKQYPGYGFDVHVGYGTVAHRRALQKLGPVKDIHRMSFRPLVEMKI